MGRKNKEAIGKHCIATYNVVVDSVLIVTISTGFEADKVKFPLKDMDRH